VEQQLQQSKEFLRLVEIGVIEEVYYCERDSPFPILAIPKKTVLWNNKSSYRFQEAQLIVEIKNANHFLVQRLGTIYYYHIKVDADGFWMIFNTDK
jgi:hypothetical protein